MCRYRALGKPPRQPSCGSDRAISSYSQSPLPLTHGACSYPTDLAADSQASTRSSAQFVYWSCKDGTLHWVAQVGPATEHVARNVGWDPSLRGTATPTNLELLVAGPSGGAGCAAGARAIPATGSAGARLAARAVEVASAQRCLRWEEKRRARRADVEILRCRARLHNPYDLHD